MNVDYVQVARWLDVSAQRFCAGIPPTDDDATWFKHNRRSNNGWPRLYRVRAAVASDHWIFTFRLAKPDNFITIIRGGVWWRAIVAVNADKFGAIVDSDEYARLRLRQVPGIDLRSDAGWVPQCV
jgi:hypothetical protein